MTATIISIAAVIIQAIIAGLIYRALKLSDERWERTQGQVDEQARDLSALRQSQAVCKIDCTREFVPAENWIRSETYTRQKLDQVGERMAELAAAIRLAEKMPEIAGNMARAIVRELKEK